MYLKNVIASLFEKIPFLDIALIRVSLLRSFNFTDNKCDVPKQMSPFVFNPFLLLKMWIFFFCLKVQQITLKPQLNDLRVITAFTVG